MTLKKFRKGKLELPNTKKLNEYKCECGIPVYNIHYIHDKKPYHISCWFKECFGEIK